jgi:CBS domain-containing protein
MNSAIERLLTLRVSDVMTKNVICVSAQDTMTQAASTLRKHGISGAPVIDSQGRSAGVLSALDFVKQRSDSSAISGDDSVSSQMTVEVHTIAANQSLMAAARLMCSKHVHRLPVLDEHQRPVGIITALDVVASLVHAIEE